MNAALRKTLTRLFALMIIITFLPSGIGHAQPPSPGRPTPAPHGPRMGVQADGLSAPEPTPPSVTPGFSFRYLQSFGVTGIAYTSDSAHLNYPFGLGSDGTNVWITELFGNRVMGYNGSGGFLLQIGIAGVQNPPDVPLSELSDVTRDGAGNIWIADQAAHVVEYSSSGSFIQELGGAWQPGTDNSHFNSPAGIAFDAGGNMYVSDGAPWWGPNGGNHRIQVYDSGHNYLTTIGVTGATGSDHLHFHGPGHIAVYGNLLYVADIGNDRIEIYDISTPGAPVYSNTIGGSTGSGPYQFDHPLGVAVDANYIYVSDRDNNRVQIYARVTRAYVATVGTGGGTGNTQFDGPTDVAVDGAGKLYVSDFWNNRVQVYTRSGTVWSYARTMGVTGVPYVTDAYHYNQPTGIAVAGDGSIYITEFGGHRLDKLNASGVSLWKIGKPGVKGDWNDNTVFDQPADVALDGSGKVYVADQNNGRVQIFNTSGTYLNTLSGFSCPTGLTIAPNGYLYVADGCDNTVQVFDSGLTWVAAMGVSGVVGTDNSHFNWPEDVVVDGTGTIYVADQGNSRVQVFDSGRNYVRTMGETAVWGDDFAHFDGVDGLSVDSANRLYVADQWNNRVQVFDSTGAYVTTVGASWGEHTGQTKSPAGVAVDSSGNLYVADRQNHRINKYAVGTPGWTQMNINAFGDRANFGIGGLAPFGGQLYAGTQNRDNTNAQLWRSSDGQAWSPVMTNGFGDSTNAAFDDLHEFNGNLYAGLGNCTNSTCNTSNGAQIWRSPDGTTWSQVVSGGFGDTVNGETYRLGVFNSQLYAGTWSWNTSVHGAEIWRSSSGDSGSWSKVVSNGFNNDSNNEAASAFESFNGYMYAGTSNNVTGGEVWRSSSGDASSWVQVNTSGFGDAANTGVWALKVFDSYLYAGAGQNSGAGAEIWRCHTCDGSDWTQVVNNGFGNAAATGRNGGISFELLDGQLYAAIRNNTTGMEVWHTADGTTWTQAGFAGFGSSENFSYSDMTAVFGSRLYVGTYNYGTGGQVWSATRPLISGNAGIANAILTYFDGGPRTAVADGSGNYSFAVSYGWSGTVTPFKIGKSFSTPTKSYSNVTADQTSQNYTVTSLPTTGSYDDADSHWTYSGVWVTIPITGLVGDTLRIGAATGASATFPFFGNGFSLHYLQYTGWGKIGVYLDGSATPMTTINTSGPVNLATYNSPVLTPGAHTVTFKHAGPAGSMIAFDSLDVRTPTTVASGSYDLTDPAWSYTGGWVSVAAPGLYNNTLEIGVAAGGSTTLLFHGTGFSMTYLQYTGWGGITVYLDGSATPYTTINTSGPAGLVTYFSPTLALGDHMVKLVQAGPAGKFVAIDSVTIAP